MTTTQREEQEIAPKPVTVSSTSSIDTNASNVHDVNTTASRLGQADNAFATTMPHPYQIVTPTTTTTVNPILPADHHYSHQAAIAPNNTPIHAPTIESVPSSVSLMARSKQGVQISPSTGVVVPAMQSTNTVPEFLYQLTKMLTDNNRDVIEWSNGKIEVHNPHKLQTNVLNRYFRHSKFASFQRQLNYFGFRKLAGKGKMAPCSYVNDATTNELGSLLLIKRKTGNEVKSKGAKKRDRPDDSGAGNISKSNDSAAINPVLAGILYRNNAVNRSTEAVTTTSSAPNSTQPVYTANNMDRKVLNHSLQPVESQQALARVAVGKGIRHNYTATNTKPAQAYRPPDPIGSKVQDSLSALASNYQHSLRDNPAAYVPQSGYQNDDKDSNTNNTTPTPPLTSQYTEDTQSFIPGSLRRDDSLVDLAMIPIVENGDGQDTSDSLLFVDFPWHDPESSSS